MSLFPLPHMPPQNINGTTSNAFVTSSDALLTSSDALVTI